MTMTTDTQPISLEERMFYEMRRHHLKMEEHAARQRDALERICNVLEGPVQIPWSDPEITPPTVLSGEQP